MNCKNVGKCTPKPETLNPEKVVTTPSVGRSHRSADKDPPRTRRGRRLGADRHFGDLLNNDGVLRVLSRLCKLIRSSTDLCSLIGVLRLNFGYFCAQGSLGFSV